MKRSVVMTSAVASASIIALCITGVASATSNSTNIGKSNIPKTVFKQDGLDSIAKTLSTTDQAVTDALKNHTLKNLVNQAGLNKKSFDQKVHDNLVSELQSQGYSQDEITIALQHKEIVRLHRSIKHD